MKSVTSAYKTAIKDYGRTFQNELIVTDGTHTETYTSAEISIEECFSQEDALSMGGFFTKEAKIKIYEPLGNVAYKNCSYTINSKLLVGNSYESVAMGVFYPSEVKVNDGSIEITAYDLMASLNESYEPSSSVATDTAILSDICTQKGITLASGTSALNQAVTLVEGTIQEQLGWLAGLQGKNAIINEENKLEFRWYSKTSQGGTTWQDIVVAWQDMNGTWANQNLDAYPIGRDAQVENGCSLDEGSFTIASLTSGTADTPLVVGSGKGLSFECPYMTQARLNAIWNALGNKTYYTGSVKTFGYPCLEVGDIVLVVDKNGVQHDFYLSKNSWEFKGGCNCTINSVGNPDAEIEFSTESPTEKKISGVKSIVQSVRATLSNLINTAEGIFSITTNSSGKTTGWTIVDNATNPQKIVRATLGGIGISSNGGSTYKTAITGDGIVADVITTGIIRGGTNNYWNLNTGDFNMTSVNTAISNAQTNAVNTSKGYTDDELDDFDTELNQTKVFNKLTNNGSARGMTMSGNQLYINADYINAGTIGAERLDIKGTASFYESDETDAYGILLMPESGNRYSTTTGYAQVKSDYVYLFQGAYTSYQFANTISGSREDVTSEIVNNDYLWQPLSDGYVFVVGGNSTTKVHVAEGDAIVGGYRPYNTATHQYDDFVKLFDVNVNGVAKFGSTTIDGDLTIHDGLMQEDCVISGTCAVPYKMITDNSTAQTWYYKDNGDGTADAWCRANLGDHIFSGQGSWGNFYYKMFDIAIPSNFFPTSIMTAYVTPYISGTGLYSVSLRTQTNTQLYGYITSFREETASKPVYVDILVKGYTF